MIALEELLAALLDAVPLAAGDAAAGVRVDVDTLSIAVPLEVRFASTGGLRASAPRGRVATGFDPPHARVEVAFARSAA